MFDLTSTFHCFEDLHVLFLGICTSREEQVASTPHSSNLRCNLFQRERARRERNEKSERRGVGGERSRNDRRSVLKSLLNLSLPNETAHIYRQYRDGGGLAAGRLRNRTVDTNLRLKRSDRADRPGQGEVCPSPFSSWLRRRQRQMTRTRDANPNVSREYFQEL